MDVDHLWLMMFIERVRRGARCGDIKGQFESLVSHWLEHTIVEEKLMTECEYPFMKAHVLEHNKVTEYLCGLQVQLNALDEDAILVLSKTLDNPNYELAQFQDILMVHIDHADRQMAEYYLKWKAAHND